jgi:hypothetical protein
MAFSSARSRRFALNTPRMAWACPSSTCSEIDGAPLGMECRGEPFVCEERWILCETGRAIPVEFMLRGAGAVRTGVTYVWTVTDWTSVTVMFVPYETNMGVTRREGDLLARRETNDWQRRRRETGRRREFVP